MSEETSGRKHRRGLVALAAGLLIAPLTVWLAPSSFAVHDNGMFELDGNTTQDSATLPPYDWEGLFGSSGQQLVTPDPINGPLLASTFLSDSALPDNTFFKQGKDITPIASGPQHWSCAPSNNPLAKDDLENAYAALVQVPNDGRDNGGDNVLYLGSERGSNNGTSFAGFWLLKGNNVGCSGTSDFSGEHTDGDILIISDYTNGGSAQDVTAYKWVGDDASGSLQQIASLSGGVCNNDPMTSAPDASCAIANMDTITTPWSPTSHPMNTFVEAGLDMNALLGGSGGCFTNFLAETRSSDQLTADLKDFVGGQFNTCPPPPIVTTASGHSTVNTPGSVQHDNATISAVGNRPAPTGTISFFLCQPSEVTSGGCEGTAGTQVGNPVDIMAGAAQSGDVSGADTTAIGTYCWRAEYSPDAASQQFYVASSETNHGSECFDIAKVQPKISTTIQVTGDEPGGLDLTTLGDTAHLTDFAGTVTGETITFKLYGPYGDGVTPTCAAADEVTAAATTGTLDATGNATTAATYDPTAAGTYVWVASYPGDDANLPVTGTCSDANESATIVGAVIDVTKSPNPPGPVSAGDTIGFDLTVENKGDVTALGVEVHDPLPTTPDGVTGGDLVWTIDPTYAGCDITGSDPQVLNCSFDEVAGQTTLPVIHIKSATTKADCGVVKNKAFISTTNGTNTDSDTASVTVLCPNLKVAKSADDADVADGLPIGFTVTVTNDDSLGVPIGRSIETSLSDPLPLGPDGSDISWTIVSEQVNGMDVDACEIVAGPDSAQTLECTFGDLQPGDVATVHVTSDTGFVDCGTYDNTATASASNADPVTASASTQVTCPADSLIVKADAALVAGGDPVGFTLTGKNAAVVITPTVAAKSARSLTRATVRALAADPVVPPGSVLGAVLTSNLPALPGIDWSISPAYTDQGTCGITGAVGHQVLTCNVGTMLPDSQFSVHITSPTTCDSGGGALTDFGVLSATNVPDVTSEDATTSINACAIVIHRPPAQTGVPINTELYWAIGLIIGGGFVLMAGVRRRKPATVTVSESE